MGDESPHVCHKVRVTIPIGRSSPRRSLELAPPAHHIGKLDVVAFALG
jgi:hypothetical protein